MKDQACDRGLEPEFCHVAIIKSTILHNEDSTQTLEQ